MAHGLLGGLAMKIPHRCTLPALLSLFAVACGTANADPTTQNDTTTTPASEHLPSNAPGVLLVHGAWADGSSWSEVVELLQADGVTVHAVQLREQSLADDVSITRDAIAGLPGPLVLAGHSYGGAVISGASDGQTSISALVYVAAFAPDSTEQLSTLETHYPTPPVNGHLVPDAQGNLTIDEPGFLEDFAPDLPRRQAFELFAVQHPLAGSIFNEVAGPAGWHTIPSYYAVSTQDRAISPDLERFFARRMNARTVEIPSSHVSLLSHPQAVTQLIEQAVRGR